jgi:glycosyltransferase involved in cell wall biosynthesis
LETEKTINILHLRDSPWVCGPGRTILETGSLVDKSKYNYIVGAFAGPNGNDSQLIDAAKSRNLQIFPIKERRSFDANILKQILDYIDTNNIHILHTHETRSDLFGLFCAKKSNIHLITTVHGWVANNLKSKILSEIDKFSLNFFDVIIVVSQKIKEQLVKYRIPEKKIHVLRNALIIDNYLPNRSDKSFRKELNISNETILIGNIGRLSPEKGQEDLIQAANRIIKQKYNVKFVFVGIGPDQKKLEKLVKNYSLSDSVLFVGYRKDINNIYNSLDLVVQCSYTEGMPNVILESLLMKVPVIATNAGGTSEIIIDGKTGYMIKPGDWLKMSTLVEEFIFESDKFKNLALKGNIYVRDNFNFTERTKKLCKIYDKIMNL